MGDDTGAVELEAWLGEWYAPAFRTACLVLGDRVEAADAVQDAFLRLWRFRASMPSGDAFRPWLYRVVVNACYSRARGEQRHRARREPGDPEPVSQAPGPDELAEVLERAEAVQRALGELPEHLRLPVVLRYYAGLSEREIALAIRRRPGTVKSRLFEARRLLAASPRLVAVSRDGEVAP
ncbi:MAG: polymerase, sigma-24 subunit, subfamily [Acidimicrobiaceae bacterium]|nr:polymerase, sigma-24 subunit, subfamily [Acidimicrobiaceae bacterium]